MSPKESSLAFDDVKEDVETSLSPALSLVIDRKLSYGRDFSAGQMPKSAAFEAEPVAIAISGKITVSF